MEAVVRTVGAEGFQRQGKIMRDGHLVLLGHSDGVVLSK